MPAPFLSIVIPVYNRPDLIVPCVDSILRTEADDVEIIIVDDCSTDNTLEVCRRLEKGNELVSVIPLEKNSGQGFARDIGLKAAKGEYAFFVDSDDEVNPDDLSSLLGDRPKWQNVDAVVFNYISCNLMKGTNTYFREDNTYTEEKILTGDELSWQYPDKAMWVYLFRRRFLIENNLHPFSLSVSEDRLFVCEAMLSVQSLFISPLHIYRYVKRGVGMSAHIMPENEFVAFLDWYRMRLLPYEKWDTKPATKNTMERLLYTCIIECSNKKQRPQINDYGNIGALEALCKNGPKDAVDIVVNNFWAKLQSKSNNLTYPIFVYPATATSSRLVMGMIEKGMKVAGHIDKIKEGYTCVGESTKLEKLRIYQLNKFKKAFSKKQYCILVYGSTVHLNHALCCDLLQIGIPEEKILAI